MTRKQALIDLRDTVAAGELTRTIAEELTAAIFGLNQIALDFGSAYAQGSLDAALALHNAVLPDEGWHVEWVAKYPSLAFKPAAYCVSVGWGTRHAAYAETPARAWLLAILSALIAQEGEA